MSRTGPAPTRNDLSRTGLSITHSGATALGASTGSASNPSFCKLARHSSSGGEGAGGGCAGAFCAGAGGGDGTGACPRGRGGGSGAATVASGMSALIRKTAAGHADRLKGYPGRMQGRSRTRASLWGRRRVLLKGKLAGHAFRLVLGRHGSVLRLCGVLVVLCLWAGWSMPATAHPHVWI